MLSHHQPVRRGLGTLQPVLFIIQSCLTLCDLTDCSPPGSSVHGTLQARILEWVAISFQGEPVYPLAPALAGGIFTEPPEKLHTKQTS